MILDSSILVALVLKEPGYESFFDKLVETKAAATGTPSIAEAGLVLTSRVGFDATGLLARLLDDFEIRSIPFGESHWRRAIEAFQKYGKGRHPAALNFGDCLTYAVASVSNQPLLYRGGDFAKTDLHLA